jgi:hypothetical protein
MNFWLQESRGCCGKRPGASRPACQRSSVGKKWKPAEKVTKDEIKVPHETGALLQEVVSNH